MRASLRSVVRSRGLVDPTRASDEEHAVAAAEWSSAGGVSSAAFKDTRSPARGFVLIRPTTRPIAGEKYSNRYSNEP
jgi:hypothetical protein